MLSKLAKKISRLGEIGGTIFMFALTLTMIAQIFCRKVLNDSLTWTDEFGAFMLVWLTMCASISCLYEDKHLAITALVEKVQKSGEVGAAIMRIAAHLLTFALLLVLFVYGIPLVTKTLSVFAISLPVSKGLIYAIMPVSALLMCVIVLDKVLNELRLIRAARGSGPSGPPKMSRRKDGEAGQC